MTNTITFEQAVAQVGTKQEAIGQCYEIWQDVKHSYPADWTFEDDWLVYMDDMLDSFDDIVAVVWHVATGNTNDWVDSIKKSGVEEEM